jgi:hypothetical protein
MCLDHESLKLLKMCQISLGSNSGVLDVSILDSQRYIGKIKVYMLQILMGWHKGSLFLSMGKMGNLGCSKIIWRLGTKKYTHVLKDPCNKILLEMDHHI